MQNDSDGGYYAIKGFAYQIDKCILELLVLAILLAPFVIGSAFQDIAGMPQLLGFYGTSLLYGAFGIIFGVLYADYTRRS